MMIALFHLAKLPHISPPSPLSWIETHFAYGVPLFFALSAFALCVGTYGRLETANDIKAFYQRRFFRIAPLFYSTILFYIPFRYLTGGTPSGLSQTFTSAIFVFNFIPGHVDGAVPAAWSIGTEMAFYLIFPIIVVVVTTYDRLAMFFIATVTIGFFWDWEVRGAAPSLRTFAAYSIFSQMCYFTGGIAAFFAWRAFRISARAQQIGAILLITSAISVVALIVAGKPYLYFLGRNIGWDYCSYLVKVSWAAGLACAVVGISLCPFKWVVNSFTQRLGQASFSIYLIHPAVIILLMKTGATDWFKRACGEFAFLVAAIALLSILLPIALWSYRYIEVPGMKLIKRFDKTARLPTAATVTS